MALLELVPKAPPGAGRRSTGGPPIEAVHDAGLVAYLASPGAAFVTGTGLVIDGGLTMQ